MLRRVREIVPTLNRSSVAGLLTACGYAVYQQIALSAALKDLGIQIDGINDENFFLLDDVWDVAHDVGAASPLGEDLVSLANECSLRMAAVVAEASSC